MKMGLLKSVDNVPGIDYYEYRDQLYWNKYAYRARVKLAGARYTWYTNDRAGLEERLNNKYTHFSLNGIERDKVINNMDALTKFIEWRNLNKKTKKATIRIEHDTVAVFANDLTLLQTLHDIDNKLEIDYTECQTAIFAGIKFFVQEPKHKYRIYLKSKKIEDTFVEDLKRTLSTSKNLYPSNALKSWLNSSSNRTWRYRFTSASHAIDYNEESTLSYLMLMHGEMFGKRYKLEKRPNTI